MRAWCATGWGWRRVAATSATGWAAGRLIASDALQRVVESGRTKPARRRMMAIDAIARGAILQRDRFRAVHCPGAVWVFCTEKGKSIASIKIAFVSARRAVSHDLVTQNKKGLRE